MLGTMPPTLKRPCKQIRTECTIAARLNANKPGTAAHGAMRAIARVVVLCSVTAAADTNFSSTPAEGAIVLIGGGARTFLCTFPDLLKRLVVPLDASRSPHPGADLYAFLKTSDPGAKQQEGHNFTYPDVDAATLREALYEYRNVVGSTIVTEPACQGDCLIGSAHTLTG